MSSAYRCYLLDGRDHIGDVHEVNAMSDTVAIQRARAVLACEPRHFTAVEVWSGPRKVDYALR